MWWWLVAVVAGRNLCRDIPCLVVSGMEYCCSILIWNLSAQQHLSLEMHTPFLCSFFWVYPLSVDLKKACTCVQEIEYVWAPWKHAVWVWEVLWPWYRMAPNFWGAQLPRISLLQFLCITAAALVTFILCKMADAKVSHVCSTARFALYLSHLFIRLLCVYNSHFNFEVWCYSLYMCFISAFVAGLLKIKHLRRALLGGLAASGLHILCQNRGETWCLNDCKQSHMTALKV